MNDDPAIVVRDLERRFGGFRVLRGLDLTVPHASVCTLFGPNGAGKTTLLRILAGLASPTRGEVTILGRRAPADAELRRRIGVVSHETFMYGDLTARENLTYYGRLYGVRDTARTDALLDRVGLARAANRHVRAFSRGMAQRLALARATLHRPDVLLLDEPFTGLDPQGCEVLTRLLSEERDRGTTVVLTTHDFARGLAVADRASVLSDGRLTWSSDGALPTPQAMATIYASALQQR